jgi:alpha-L-rhamnosidase
MKKYLAVLLPALLLFAAGIPDGRSPSGLMVEFIREPQGVKIMDLKPSFAWLLPPASKRQSAFRILVASSPEKCAEGKADAWDSGKVNSPNSTDVEFSNSSLKPNHTYYWCVRTWDYSGKPSPYSKIQKFTTGNPDGYQTTQNSFIYTFRNPVFSKEVSSGHWFIDFGKDAFGTLVLKHSPLKADTVIIRLGEKISSPLSINRKPGASIRYSEIRVKLLPGKTEYIVQPDPDARNTGPAAVHLPDSVGIITPFRYAEIENAPVGFKPENMSQRVLTIYYDNEASSFSSSDTTLDQVWKLSKYSILATSFAGLYIDGDRERIPYEADAYINQLGHYYTDREYAMARATNEYFIDHPTWPTEWILHTVPLFFNDFMFTDDIGSVRHFYRELKNKTLFMLDRGDGLISSLRVNGDIMKELGFKNEKERIRDIVDWPPAQKDTGWKLAGPDGERDGYDMKDVNTVVNAFYYHGLVLMSELSGYLGEKEDSVFFSNKALATFRSFNEKLFSSEKGIYVDGEGSDHSSLHANMMALAFGLVPEENTGKVVEFIKSRGMACSVYGAQYLLEALYKAGEEDYALTLLTSDSDRSWYNMIRSGSTITMEAWDMKYKPNSDWNHAWGAAPANIIPQYLWGISPASPGYAKAIMKPQPGKLKYSRIVVPTIRGSIVAEMHNNGKNIEYLVYIPSNMKCDFIVPGSGKIISLSAGFNKIFLNRFTV